ncbi:hypothetical protein DPMN_169902 [Dreissena polymorpha]|uniref:Uncharacterized protein n=1 Tax=Dreissena polymorpha TaxID=45954 RepID=A0A9D4DWD2_DREPO|nr:hypothetical protein DPMN_169902 [Dreissena polymorpha]
MRLALETRINGVEHRVDRLGHATEGAGIAVAEVTSRVEHWDQQDKFREDTRYLKSRSMRNKLIFTDEPEIMVETPKSTESDGN